MLLITIEYLQLYKVDNDPSIMLLVTAERLIYGHKYASYRKDTRISGDESALNQFKKRKIVTQSLWCYNLEVIFMLVIYWRLKTILLPYFRIIDWWSICWDTIRYTWRYTLTSRHKKLAKGLGLYKWEEKSSEYLKDNQKVRENMNTRICGRHSGKIDVPERL